MCFFVAGFAWVACEYGCVCRVDKQIDDDGDEEKKTSHYSASLSPYICISSTTTVRDGNEYSRTVVLLLNSLLIIKRLGSNVLFGDGTLVLPTVYRIFHTSYVFWNYAVGKRPHRNQTEAL